MSKKRIVDDELTPEERKHKGLIFGMIFGLMVGTVVGILLGGNIGVTSGIGMCVGLTIGALCDARSKTTETKEDEDITST